MREVQGAAGKVGREATRGLRHITSVFNAFRIAEGREFHSSGSAQSYDGGMNFLGILGEQRNTAPAERGAELVCSWGGDVSDPLHWDVPYKRTPGTLLDYNGSGDVYQNNDPRYLLTVGSAGLIVNEVVVHDQKDLIDMVMGEAGGLKRLFYRLFSSRLEGKAVNRLQELNRRCADGQVTLQIF